MRFEWTSNKAKENERRHYVRFDEAVLAFDDENGLESFDALNSDNEIRYRLIALSPIRLLFVAYTIRETRGEEIIRLISARKATAYETELYSYEQR